MSTSRALAVVAALACIALLVVMLRHRDVAASRVESNVAAGLDVRLSDAQYSARTPAPSRDLITRDPQAAARLWQARAERVIIAKNRKNYGDEIARLMQLPFGESWAALMHRAKDGDLRATAAAVSVTAVCAAEPIPERRNPNPSPVSGFYKDLPDAWRPFVDGISDLRRDLHERMVAHCGSGHADPDLTDAYLQAGNTDADIDLAALNQDKVQAIADLRALIAQHDSAHGRFTLAYLLIESRDSEERAEGRALLEQLAPDDPGASGLLGYCLETGCGGSAADPTTARPLLEQAAGLGAGVSTLMDVLHESGEDAAAWAWSLYELELAIAGCFEAVYPSYQSIAMAAQEEAQRKSVLGPAEQNAGLAMNYAISGRWERQAKERLSCD